MTIQRQYKRSTLTGAALFLLLFGLLWLVNAAPSEAADANWQARYWSNRNLSGDPVLRRDESAIDHDWGGDSPDNLLFPGGDNFSARWTRVINLPAGTWRFTATMDDGMRVWVNDTQIINSWIDSQVRTLQGDITVGAGDHNVRVEYYEAGGQAVAKLSWAQIGSPPTQPPVPGSWRGEYYNGTTPGGSPLLVRDDPAISFNWGQGSPAPNIPSDRFSARWTRTVNLNAGRYRFNVFTDDGVRLWVNGQLLIDQWHDAQGRGYSAEVDLPGGTTSLQMDYFENIGDAQANLSWSQISGSVTQPPVPGSWLGQYYNGTNPGSGSPLLVRDDPAINFNWGLGSPAANIPSDRFSVRWTRTVNLAAGRYRFTVLADDGVRLWVNNALIIDEWHDAQGRTYSAERDLPGGTTTLQMDYYENIGDARANLSWVQLSGTTTPPTTPPATAGTATVLVNRLNVRNGPGTRFGLVTTLNRGQTIPLVGYRDATGTWAMVNYNNTNAWVSALPGYLQTTVPVSTMPVWPGGVTGAIPPGTPLATVGSRVSALNMRTGPDTTFDIITSLRAGTVVQMIGRNAASSWIQVRAAGGETGWMSAPFLIPSTPVSGLPITG